MNNTPTCISQTVSAVEIISVVECRQRKSPRTETRLCGRLVPSLERLQNLNNDHHLAAKYKYRQNFYDDWCSNDHDGSYPYHLRRLQSPLPGGHVNRVRLCEILQPRLHIVRDILFTDEALFVWDGITSTRNSHS